MELGGAIGVGLHFLQFVNPQPIDFQFYEFKNDMRFCKPPLLILSKKTESLPFFRISFSML
jgi:hypothetical protein